MVVSADTKPDQLTHSIVVVVATKRGCVEVNLETGFSKFAAVESAAILGCLNMCICSCDMHVVILHVK